MGQEDIKTTQIYLQTDDKRKLEAMNTLTQNRYSKKEISV